VVPLLQAHDHTGLEIHGYASVQRPDDLTATLRQAADVWHDALGVSDEALAEQIRADGIDILVDLTMHMSQNRLLLFARQPAPVQVTWLAYPGGTGLSAFAFRLTDHHLDPEGAPWSESVEQPLRLPDSWFCYDPIDEFPPVGELPALQEGRVTFGSLNNFGKLNEAVFTVWIKVLSAVEGSRLLLVCPDGQTRERVRQFFLSHGIGEDRLELVGLCPYFDYLRLYQRIDIGLDPFPFSGGTTTCDATWMGVPVVTLPGQRGVSRMGLSILSTVGLPELIAQSEEEYVKIARTLAQDLPRLAALRAGLRERMKASPFMDAPRFARHVEAAYRTMWRAWCAR
jgi:predicted O-linked N-acetylglucosamine transferase (SPINDLY family)